MHPRGFFHLLGCSFYLVEYATNQSCFLNQGKLSVDLPAYIQKQLNNCL